MGESKKLSERKTILIQQQEELVAKKTELEELHMKIVAAVESLRSMHKQTVEQSRSLRVFAQRLGVTTEKKNETEIVPETSMFSRFAKASQALSGVVNGI